MEGPKTLSSQLSRKQEEWFLLLSVLLTDAHPDQGRDGGREAGFIKKSKKRSKWAPSFVNFLLTDAHPDQGRDGGPEAGLRRPGGGLVLRHRLVALLHRRLRPLRQGLQVGGTPRGCFRRGNGGRGWLAPKGVVGRSGQCVRCIAVRTAPTALRPPPAPAFPGLLQAHRQPLPWTLLCRQPPSAKRHWRGSTGTGAGLLTSGVAALAEAASCSTGAPFPAAAAATERRGGEGAGHDFHTCAHTHAAGAQAPPIARHDSPPAATLTCHALGATRPGGGRAPQRQLPRRQRPHAAAGVERGLHLLKVLDPTMGRG